MTDLYRQAVELGNTLPPEMQDEIARMVMAYAGKGTEIYQLTPEEHAAQDEADEAIARGDFATDEEMKALFDEFKL